MLTYEEACKVEVGDYVVLDLVFSGEPYDVPLLVREAKRDVASGDVQFLVRAEELDDEGNIVIADAWIGWGACRDWITGRFDQYHEFDLAPLGPIDELEREQKKLNELIKAQEAESRRKELLRQQMENTNRNDNYSQSFGVWQINDQMGQPIAKYDKTNEHVIFRSRGRKYGKREIDLLSNTSNIDVPLLPKWDTPKRNKP